MATKPLPSQEVLRQLLDYDPETGVLRWKERGLDLFKDSGWGREYSCRAWNARYAGEEAFTTVNSNGYRHGTIHGRFFSAHRVIWAHVNGHWPMGEIDHINGDRSDNRLANLRSVGPCQNRQNMRRSTRNTTGVVGVGIHKASGKWHARITASRRPISLGYFDTFEEAVRARKEGEAKYGFHPNHGRAA